ncbi:TIGR00725 family protein [Thermodesulfobacteriota bacterium]
MIIGVVGAGSCNDEQHEKAHEIGRLIAKAGAMLVTGGLGGVMEAASKGASEEGGAVIGILPGSSKHDANKYVTVPIITDAAHMRNVIIANTADVIIAVFGGYGTLSEVAISLKLGKKVVAFDSWEIEGTLTAKTPAEAVELALDNI